MNDTSSRTASAASSGGKHHTQILLRNYWQGINIGDIGHAPGAISLIERYFPGAEVTLWPNPLEYGSREMLQTGYPRLKVAEGQLDANDNPTTPALQMAWEEADFYLSGSGSGFPAYGHAAAFHRRTGKPYGVFAVSVDPISGFGPGRLPNGGTLAQIHTLATALPPTHLDGDQRYAIEHASFVFCRDTISRDYLHSQNVKTPLIEFGPDSQLGMHLRDDAKGDSFRKSHQLEERKYLCVIPRLRYTPYYQIHQRPPTADELTRDEINEKWKEEDHAKLRGMIIQYVRETGNRVLACPEMTYQIPLAKELLLDPLPADVKSSVVWREIYWLPDEAAAIYAKAQAVVSLECHSPLIALRHGTPAIHIRQPTDTCKGQMYRDLGWDEWFFEVDETSGSELWGRLEEIHRAPKGASEKVHALMAGIERHQRRMLEVLRETAVIEH